MIRLGAFSALLALALAACGREEARPPETGPETAQDDPVARWAALLPDDLRHRANACPFECCVYGDWTPTGEVPLRARPRHAEAVQATIPADQTFAADSGFVEVTGVAVVAVTDSLLAEPGAYLAPGDTLVVLDHVGEGFWNVWDGERVRQVSGFWGAGVSPRSGEVIGEARYAREWWVHATTPSGQKGWFNADSVARLRGADKCAGPEPI